MEKLLKLSLLLSLATFSLSDSTSTTFFLDCGSSTGTNRSGDNPSRTFVPDSRFLDSGSSSNSLTDPSQAPDGLYTTARVFTATASYQFKITSNGTYILRLHFFPFSTQHNNLSAARFDVSALNRYLLLSNFSVPTTTASPVIKEYFIWVEADELTVSFTPNPTAFVSAIEVFNAPSNLLGNARPTPIGGAQLGGQLSQQALETIYRINVGGPEVTPANDTLWRTWATDESSFISKQMAFANRTSERITYQTDKGLTNKIAPSIVYSTARTMAVTPTLVISNPNFNFNLTWSFRVPQGFTYFIRMHFCDFTSQTSTQLYFDVYLGDLLAYQDLHPGQFTDDTLTSAFYVDFAVSAGVGPLNISIGRSSRSNPYTANAILNGLEIMKVNNSGGSLDGVSYNPVGTKKRIDVSVSVLIASVLGGLVVIAALVAAFVFVCRRRRPKTRPSPQKQESVNPTSWSPHPDYGANSVSRLTISPSASPNVNLDLQISIVEIKFATNNFDDSLVVGTGGFGNVYKGVLRDGTKVAVKRGMPGSRQGYPEFQTEVIVLSRIRHRHLVSLIGYCEEQAEMILVYEYMEKGPLRKYLYGDLGTCLSWKQRLQICIDAARGLHYLHTGHSQNIIHRDVKSTNILLDEDYRAKVSDFGLSRLGPSFGETHVSTNVKGTFGYLDPEYFKVQKLTDKSDVYSFGVLLFEVLCARPVIDQTVPREQSSLAEWALHWQRYGKLEKIIDQRLAGEINANSLRKFGETAASCLAEYGIDRPSIGNVLWSLEYALQLQETELKREPHEDSGTVGTSIQVAALRRVPSTSTTIGEEEGNAGLTDQSSSNVFSQLDINKDQKKKICSVCGKIGHLAKKSWQRKKKICSVCGKIGHLAKKSWQRKDKVNSNNNTGNAPSSS